MLGGSGMRDKYGISYPIFNVLGTTDESSAIINFRKVSLHRKCLEHKKKE